MLEAERRAEEACEGGKSVAGRCSGGMTMSWPVWCDRKPTLMTQPLDDLTRPPTHE